MLPPQDHAFFVSVHIPKTAGTTVATVLDRVYQRKVLFDYAPSESYNTPDPLIRQNANFIASFFRGIHGHFGVTRHLPVFGGAKYISCVRHPVDRIISQYNHEYNDNGPGSYWHRPIRSGEMSVVDFAGLAGIGNAMTLHLAGLDLVDYDLLMITENIHASFTLLNYVVGAMNIERYFGIPPNLPRSNEGTAREHQFEFPEAVKVEIYKRAQQDVELYRRAVEMFSAKARIYA
ncbi:sulfotransferase family protein [Roseomonas frigidaquae]|uniref:Sulfotransferase family protein n=1 Tax=Falsiroseomonas frigidaquae TaxID=487318 RepID=A0ABX1F4U6_9PROT|nr:sulfotransferase family 2 domain-containing protein [Falsiroseomonas frigidaquae]NKE47406.1 sulfotransferase family protein [Falsiroseomonas frigidaquae]